jgi:hypothetical protein
MSDQAENSPKHQNLPLRHQNCVPRMAGDERWLQVLVAVQVSMAVQVSVAVQAVDCLSLCRLPVTSKTQNHSKTNIQTKI